MAQEACDIAGHEVFELKLERIAVSTINSSSGTLFAQLHMHPYEKRVRQFVRAISHDCQGLRRNVVYPPGQKSVFKKNRDAPKYASRCIFCLSAKPDCLAQCCRRYFLLVLALPKLPLSSTVCCASSVRIRLCKPCNSLRAACCLLLRSCAC